MMQQLPFPSAEYELITDLQSLLGDCRSEYYGTGIGDDAAVRKDAAGNQMVLTTDLSVEHVHFSLRYMTMQEVGYRAMVTNLSDCAAMGAQPDSALVQLVVPGEEEGNRLNSIRELYRGFEEACTRWHFPVVGGDISLGVQWVIGITLVGRVEKQNRVVLRTGAQSGDGLWVTGFPGCSAAGLNILKKWGRDSVPELYHLLVENHIRPVPRVEPGRVLAADPAVHAMMDLSDGLSKDCRTLSYENRCGIILSPDTSQVPPAMVQLSRETGMSWKEWFFHGGEDYELLFAASGQFDVSRYAANLPGVHLLQIGAFSDQVNGVVYESKGIRTPLANRGFDHMGAILH